MEVDEKETKIPEFGNIGENMRKKTQKKKTQLETGPDSLGVMRRAVVVLTRLPEYKISALRPPTPQQFYSEDDSLSSSDSDMQWKPDGDSSDSDFSSSHNKRKIRKSIKSDPSRASAPQTSNNNNNGKVRRQKNTTNKNTVFLYSAWIWEYLAVKVMYEFYIHIIISNWYLQSFRVISFNINRVCFSTVSELTPVIVSSVFSYSNETTTMRPILPVEEVTVNMMVLAKKNTMRWQRGKILEMITKGKKITLLFCRTESWKKTHI